MNPIKLLIEGYDSIQWMKEHIAIWKAEDRYRSQRNYARKAGDTDAQTKWQGKLSKVQETEKEHWKAKK